MREARAPAAWFTCLGLPLVEAEAIDLADYLRGIGIAANTPVVLVDSWQAAEATLKNPQWDQSWWQAEEAERARLLKACGGSDAALKTLTQATDEVTEALHGAAAVAAARSGVADPYLVRVAAGAALQAVHQAALAEQAGEADHPFIKKRGLYASGHWLLGTYTGKLGQEFLIF